MPRILTYIPFAAIAVTGIAISYYFGDFAYTRFFGALWVVAGLWLIFVRELPVNFGETTVLRLKGWRKAVVIVPVFCLGYALIMYAPEITCFSSRYKHLCE
jgi:hypothetical protein